DAKVQAYTSQVHESAAGRMSEVMSKATEENVTAIREQGEQAVQSLREAGQDPHSSAEQRALDTSTAGKDEGVIQRWAGQATEAVTHVDERWVRGLSGLTGPSLAHAVETVSRADRALRQLTEYVRQAQSAAAVVKQTIAAVAEIKVHTQFEQTASA